MAPLGVNMGYAEYCSWKVAKIFITKDKYTFAEQQTKKTASNMPK
jgi:hypothetical protein